MKPITIEKAAKTIDEIVNKAENDFYRANSRYPSLVNEDDYVLLGQHINVDEEHKKNDGVYPGDIGLKFIRNYFQRQGFVDFAGKDGEKVLDGILGRVNYNPPPREFQRRIKALNQLIKKGVSFPPDYHAMVETMQNISKACFLHSYEAAIEGGPWNPGGKKIPSPKDPTGEKYQQGFQGLGNWFVNVSGLNLGIMDYNKSYQDYIKWWKDQAEAEPKPDRNYYK